MGYQLGIDVGSSTTVVAVADGGWPAVLTLSGGRTTPSVLYMPQAGGVLFGRAAARRALIDPDRAAGGFLRRLGEPGHIIVGGAAYSPDGLLARLVGHIVGLVVAARGEQPEQIVVAHPTFWPQRRRELFADAAGQLSDVAAPVSTCASADAIGTLLARRSATRIVDLVGVYDFGADFFDSAVLSFSPFGFQQLGTSFGVNHAGGSDFDELLLDRVLAEAGTSREQLPRTDPAVSAALGRLRQECSQAKEYLAEEDEVEVALAVPGVAATSVVLRRAELETLVAPVVEDTVRAFRRTLRMGEATAEDLSSVLLYGGTARMPVVAAQMRAAFPTVGRWEYGSEDDIATGAALIAMRLAERAAGEEVTSVIRPPDTTPPILSAPPLGSVPPLRSNPPTGTPAAAGAAAFGAAAGGAADDTLISRSGQGTPPLPVPPAESFGGQPSTPPSIDLPDTTRAGEYPSSGDSAAGHPAPAQTGAGHQDQAHQHPEYQTAYQDAGDQDAGYQDAGYTVAASSADLTTTFNPTTTAGGSGVGAGGGGGTAGPAGAAGASATSTSGGPGLEPVAPLPSQAGTSAGTHAAPRGGLFAGLSRPTLAAAVAAIVFVAAGTTLGIVLTGGDDSSSSAITPIAAPVTTAPATTAPAAPAAPGPNTVLVAGSSEVAPITETAYAGFREVQQNVTVSVEASTTEDGFAELCAGDIDVAGASFEFDPSFSKDAGCADQIVGFEIAHHTLPIVVNPQNTWARCMTLDQVRQVWDAGSTINRWNQIDPSFPDEPITFVGPSRDTVQAQVFNATVNDASDRSRQYQESDLSGVANDVAGDRLAMGFLDFPTFETFGDRLKGLEIDNGEGCVEPNAVTAGTGFYLPLCKPVFVYARKDSLQKPATAAFMRYYMENGEKIAFDAHYVPRAQTTIQENVTRIDELTQGVPPVTA